MNFTTTHGQAIGRRGAALLAALLRARGPVAADPPFGRALSVTSIFVETDDSRDTGWLIATSPELHAGFSPRTRLRFELDRR